MAGKRQRPSNLGRSGKRSPMGLRKSSRAGVVVRVGNTGKRPGLVLSIPAWRLCLSVTKGNCARNTINP